MKTHRFAAVAAAVPLIAAAWSSSSVVSRTTKASAAQPLKVGFILDGAINDEGFNTAVYDGIEQVVHKFGSRVQVTYKQNVPESPQAAQVINSLIQGGDNLVVGTSFGYHTFIAAAAKAHPNVKFLQYESTELAPNLSEFYFGIDQAWYLAGMAAAAASKTGHLGFVASFPIPSLLIQVNGFELGARAVNPKATTRVVFLNSWFNPPQSTQAAKSLLASGEDVLANALDDASVVQVAESKGVPVVGHDLNQEKYAPTQWLTGAEFIFGPYFVQQVKAVLNGSWKSQNYFGLLSNGVTGLAPFGTAYHKEVPAKVRTLVQHKEQQLRAGKFHVFTGPIFDQKGKLEVKPHHTLTASGKEQMNYLVKGVLGTTGS